MAKDFKTGQIRTSKIIGKDGDTADEKKIVFYPSTDPPDYDGGDPGVDLGGDDVSFVFAGSPGDKEAAVPSGGVALFNGDVVVSGTLYAENQIIEVTSSTSSSLIIEGANKEIHGEDVAIHITGTQQGHIMWDEGHASIGETDEKIYINANDGIHEGSTVLGLVGNASANHIATCFDIEAHVSNEVAVVAADLASVEVRVTDTENALAAEIADTNADVSSIDTRVAAEEGARASADTSLETRLAAEESARATDDTSLEVRLAAEETARAAADTSLQTRLTAEEAALIAEIAATDGEVSSIDTRIATDEAALAELYSTNSGEGASQVGIEDSGSNFTSTNVEGALAELAASSGGGGGGGNLTTKGDLEVFTTAQTRLGVGADGDILTADSTAASGLAWAPPSGGGSMTFTISDGATPTAGAQTIEDGNTLTVTGGVGLTTSVTATDNLEISLDDTLVTIGTYGDAANVPQLTVDQQGRITGVTNVAISAGGGSSSGAPGIIQVSDGSGGFDAASVFKYHPNAVPAESRVSISTGGTVTSPDARLEIVNAQADSFHCLRLEQLIHTSVPSTRSNMIPLLIESNTDDVTADLALANKGTIGQIILANNFVSGAPPTYKSSTISLDDDDFKILNNQNNGIVQIIGIADSGLGTPQVQYDVIRSEGNAAQGPCVTMLTDTMSVASTAIVSSPDINFYVDGVPGSLGSTGATAVKKSAQFGGDLSVNGFVSRGGLIQLTKDTPQRIAPPAWNGLTTWDFTNLPRGVITFDNALFNDPLNTFYSFTPGNDHLTVERDGVYRISYGAWTWQSVNTDLSVNDGSPGAPPSGQTATLGQRSNVTGRLVKDTGSGFSIVDNSYSSCYLRFTYITKHLFTATTFVSANAGDKIGVEIAWVGGDNPGGAEYSVRDGQTWLTVEKIQ